MHPFFRISTILTLTLALTGSAAANDPKVGDTFLKDLLAPIAAPETAKKPEPSRPQAKKSPSTSSTPKKRRTTRRNAGPVKSPGIPPAKPTFLNDTQDIKEVDVQPVQTNKIRIGNDTPRSPRKKTAYDDANSAIMPARPLVAQTPIDPRESYEHCSSIVQQDKPDGQDCFPVTVTHDCASERYIVVCRHTPEGKSCQYASEPLLPNKNLIFMLCLPQKNYILRHAACQDLQGCRNFVDP